MIIVLKQYLIQAIVLINGHKTLMVISILPTYFAKKRYSKLK